MKTFRKKSSVITSLIIFLFYSCEGPRLLTDCKANQFDYSLYNTYKGQMLKLDPKKFSTTKSTIEETHQAILDEINLQLGTDLTYSTEFLSLDLGNADSVTQWAYDQNLIDQIDEHILNNFMNSLSSMSVEEALDELEITVIENALNQEKVQQYEALANAIKLIHDDDPSFFSSNEQRSCFWSVVGIIFAFAGLVVGCNPAAAIVTVGTACYLAAANYVRASISLALAC